ncbi:MAG TPA: class I SAM-dependent methyltransferase [Gaiellaceae bacterium]|nr:class I SAM-dependent methyltransferase [Gaiellaceae bacterium]
MLDRRSPSTHVAFQTRLMGELGYRVAAGARVLDFGCGDGVLVQAYREAGFQAYGCDIVLPEETPVLRLIETPYRLPFADASFAAVFSDQVFEHVQDYGAALREIRRVLAPGGISFHVFPGRWRPLEPHTSIPLGTVIRAKRWLQLWTALGVRNEHQRGKGAAEVAAIYHRYLREATAYHSRRRILLEAAPLFAEVRFVEREMMRVAGGRASRLSRALGEPRWLARLYSDLRSRALFLVRGSA